MISKNTNNKTIYIIRIIVTILLISYSILINSLGLKALLSPHDLNGKIETLLVFVLAVPLYATILSIWNYWFPSRYK